MLQGHVNSEHKIQNIQEVAWPHVRCFRFGVILISCHTQVDSPHTLPLSVPVWCLSSFTLCFILIEQAQQPTQLVFPSVFHPLARVLLSATSALHVPHPAFPYFSRRFPFPKLFSSLSVFSPF